MANIFCDSCGEVIPTADMKVKERVIGKGADGGNVTELYFTCPSCQKRYTVTVLDRKMHLTIQKRTQLRGRIERGIRDRASEMQLRKWRDEDQKLKERLLKMTAHLKETWKDELQETESEGEE